MCKGRAFVCKNIGDYIQSVASRQYCQPLDEYIEQEEADRYYPKDKKKIRLIMNGWFQWRAENWPPSEYIYPLLVSMHISPLKADKLLCPKGVEFLKKYAPVGCRDYYTKSILESYGVPAYFSACMTLTLGKSYSVDDKKRKGIFFVDPYFEVPELHKDINGNRKLNYKFALQTLASFFKHLPTICRLAQKPFFKVYSPTGFLDRNDKKYRAYYKATLFYNLYSKKFDKKMLLEADYITHWMDVDMSGKVTNIDLLDIAEGLVKKYAAAKIVITSRIHAGLPCLGLNTPVVFIANKEVTSENGNFNTPGRLGGLIDLFRVLSLDEKGFTSDDIVLSRIEKFTLNSNFDNKTDWKKYASELDKKAKEFMSD